MRIGKRTVRIALRVTGVVLALVALIGFAHTPAGRPWLNALRGAPGCPVDLDGDPAAVEAFRVKQAQRARGSEAAASRRALAFELGKTDRASVLAFMEQRGASCEAKASGRVLACKHVPETLSGHCGPRIEDLQLHFDPKGTLVAIDLFRTGTSGQDALALLAERDRALQEQVGPATRELGERKAGYLESGYLHRTSLEYRYSDYVAELSATSFGPRGIRVREQYQLAL